MHNIALSSSVPNGSWLDIQWTITKVCYFLIGSGAYLHTVAFSDLSSLMANAPYWTSKALLGIYVQFCSWLEGSFKYCCSRGSAKANIAIGINKCIFCDLSSAKANAIYLCPKSLPIGHLLQRPTLQLWLTNGISCNSTWLCSKWHHVRLPERNLSAEVLSVYVDPCNTLRIKSRLGCSPPFFPPPFWLTAWKASGQTALSWCGICFRLLFLCLGFSWSCLCQTEWLWRPCWPRLCLQGFHFHAKAPEMFIRTSTHLFKPSVPAHQDLHPHPCWGLTKPEFISKSFEVS